jgi:phosphodiesterase/alkaline phosphatase D-like protein
MKIAATLLFLLVVSGISFAQPPHPSALSAPASEVRVTYGPVARVTAAGTIFIAWSTNVSSATALQYGSSPDKLDQMAQTPTEGTTHRIQLTDLKPDTTYYYRVVVPEAGAGPREAMVNVASFRTPAAKPAK